MPAPAASRSRLLGAIAATAAVLALIGCSTEPTPPTKPSHSTAPLFSSDDEALAAAEAALTAYWDMSNLISQEGGVNPERMAAVASPDWTALAITDFAALASKGWIQHGSVRFDSVELQQWFTGQKTATVIVTSCFDYSSRFYLNGEGAQVDLSNVSSRRPFEVVLDRYEAEQDFIVDSIEPWSDREC
ncbi:hypothetical protein [Homoserinimonas hongtaonis]|uniref:hypothetical protein n=1 Tax=Homoserinimonas hongtaonis TaxID=2079791 RepID=UPI000D3857F5|nr:hypothetical protein [Salinibacterium hongtaonis]AWB89467.1 hypothetical protein C2138_07870 [Salinibacterium hongtaonis]